MLVFKARWLLLALSTMGSACSYAPHPGEGKQECYARRCPDGYVCADDNRCYSAGKVPVAPGTGGAMAGTGGAMVGTGGAGGVGAGGATVPIKDAGIPGTGGGGLPSTGGRMGTGGAVGADAATTPANTGTVMTIANSQAQGAMTGYGWIALGAKETVTDPTCGSPAGPISSTVLCANTNWSTPYAYCMTGSAPPAVTTADYTDSWGIDIGVDATPVAGGVLGQSFTTIAFTMTGAASTGLRAQVHKKGDLDTKSYCAPMVSGISITLTTFNTSCWDGNGTNFAAQDVPNIDKVSVQIPASSVATTVTNLCLVGITFGK